MGKGKKDFVSWFGVDEKINQVQEEVIGEEEEILSTQKRARGSQSRSLGQRRVEGRQKGVPKVSFFAFPSGSSWWV